MHHYPDSPRPEVAEFVPATTKRLLDVGCFQGAFGARLVERGIEVWGVEVDEFAARVASTRLTRVLVGAYPAVLPAGETFDCIIFNDVLEHIVDPQRVLAVARSHLTERGCVIASLPNVRNISVIAPLVLYGRWDYADAGLLDRTHVRWFTKSTMRELFEGAGYRVERQVPINATALTGRLRVLKLLGRRNEEFVVAQYLLLAHPCQTA